MNMEMQSSLPAAPSAAEETVKVAIIEDLRDIRECLAILINGTPGFQCVGVYRSMEEALDRIRFNLPDLALCDIGLPGMSGLEGIKILKQRHPDMQIIMLTVYNDDERIFDALCAGASGYLLKKTPPAQILEALKETVAGGAPMSPEVARKVIRLFREIRPPERADYQLTGHEIRILKLLAEGMSYKSVAAALSVSVKTISFHLQKVYQKLQVHSKNEAVAKALRNRLIS